MMDRRYTILLDLMTGSKLVTGWERLDRLVELGVKNVEKDIDYYWIVDGLEAIRDIITDDRRFDQLMELGEKYVKKGKNIELVLSFGFASVKDLVTNDDRFNRLIELCERCLEEGISCTRILEDGFGTVKHLIEKDEDLTYYGEKLIRLSVKTRDSGINYVDVLKELYSQRHNIRTGEDLSRSWEEVLEKFRKVRTPR